MRMRKIKVQRYLQDTSHCTIGAAATIANYCNKEIDYDIAKQIAYKFFHIQSKEYFDGLSTGEIGMLLNELGFGKVTVVSSNLDCLDYAWSSESNKSMVELLHKTSRRKHVPYPGDCKLMAKFLERKGNQLVLDYNFGEHIRSALDRDIPVIITFNWTMFFRLPKNKGAYEEHAVVANGYSAKKVNIIDSHNAFYKYKLKKYGKGEYSMTWENLMSVMGFGDVIIPEDYRGLKDYELV